MTLGLIRNNHEKNQQKIGAKLIFFSDHRGISGTYLLERCRVSISIL